MDDIDDGPLFEPIKTQNHVRREGRKLAYSSRRKGCYKYGYATRKQALNARSHALKARPGQFLTIYKCRRNCDLWHLTHQPEKPKK